VQQNANRREFVEQNQMPIDELSSKQVFKDVQEDDNYDDDEEIA
jgi:hypothetical protein